MAIEESIERLRTTLSDITTSLGNKGVTAEGLKASQVPDKIREIETKPGEPYAGAAKDLFKKNQYSSSIVIPDYIIFTDQKPSKDAEVLDWSADGKKGVVKWFDNDEIGMITLYISTRREGVKVIFPSDSSYMFTRYNSGVQENNRTKSIQFNSLVDTSQVINMTSMFENCNSLTELDLSCFDVSSVTNMNKLFKQCTGLKNLNFGNWDVSKVTTMEYMFQNMRLDELDLSMFKTDSLTSIYYMFDSCTLLTTLDLSSFNVSNLTNIKSAFSSCPKLSTIYASEWCKINTKISSKDMPFYDNTALPGYSSSKRTYSYCKWKENGGYFTNPAEKAN